ncbi:hypothetical protein C8R46DRAFT_1345226 [Mycena filopes]|nr:hypothetical protein C8R46DRAFT_1345226 [Mycena filopes]
MKPKNLVLRRRLAYVESQLETESTSSRHSPRLKEERQRRLIEEKIDIQKSLDSIVYPILAIPVEITAEILIHCFQLTLVERTPRLWAALEVARWAGPNLAFLVHLWFCRAGGAPKSLSLRLSFRRCPNSFFTTIYRCQCCPSSLLFAEHWAHLTSFHGSNLTPTECLALLSHTPRLTHCEFHLLQGSLPPSTPTSRVVLANLEHLCFDMYTDSSPILLDSITCPTLRSFEMTAFYRTIPDTPLLPFLERSPHIEVFAISVSRPDSGILFAMLKAMPTLTSLRVTARDSAIFDLLRLLSDSPTFLPHITNIALSLYTRFGWTDSQVKTWIDAITSRWEA